MLIIIKTIFQFFFSIENLKNENETINKEKTKWV